MTDRPRFRFIAGIVLSAWMSAISSAAFASSAKTSEAPPASLLPSSAASTSQILQPRVVQVGDRGRIVAQIQLMLKALNLYQGELHGIYNADTARSVTQFQQAHRLTPTGTVDRSTWTQIRQEFDRVRSGDFNAQAFQPSLEMKLEPSRTSVTTPIEPSQSNAQPNVQSNAPSHLSDSDFDSDSDRGLAARFSWLPYGVTGVAIAIIFYSIGRMSHSQRFQRRLLVRGSKSITTSSKTAITAVESDPSPTLGTKTLGTKTSRTSGTPAAVLPQPQSCVTKSGAMPSSGSGSSLIRPLPTGFQSDLAPSLRPNPDPKITTGEMNTPIGINPTTRIAPPTPIQSQLQNLRSSDPAIRRRAIWELGQTGTTDTVQPLVDLMLEVDSQQRSLILAAISEIGVRTLKPLSHALVTSMQDDSSDVRKNAIRDMTRIYELLSQVTAVLRHATGDQDDDVRQTASWALEQLSRIRLTSFSTVAAASTSLGDRAIPTTDRRTDISISDSPTADISTTELSMTDGAANRAVDVSSHQDFS